MDQRIFRNSENNLDNIYLRPLLELIEKMKLEYHAEYSIRQELMAQSNPVDMVVFGGLVDDWRIRRYMHGSHALLYEGWPARYAGNRVFPNGFLEVDLAIPATTDVEIKIYAARENTEKLTAILNGHKQYCILDEDGCCRLRARGSGKSIVLRIEKDGDKYPLIYAVIVNVL